jgi:hypothetical protein
MTLYTIFYLYQQVEKELNGLLGRKHYHINSPISILRQLSTAELYLGINT